MLREQITEQFYFNISYCGISLFSNRFIGKHSMP